MRSTGSGAASSSSTKTDPSPTVSHIRREEFLNEAQRVLESPFPFRSPNKPILKVSSSSLPDDVKNMPLEKHKELCDIYDEAKTHAQSLMCSHLIAISSGNSNVVTPLPKFRYSGTLSSVQRSTTEEDVHSLKLYFNIARAVLQDPKPPRSSNAAKFILFCTKKSLDFLEKLKHNSSFSVGRNASASHFLEVLEGVKIFYSLVSYLEVVSDRLSDVFLSVRRLMGLESRRISGNSSLDIAEYQPRFGPIIKAISVNVIQTLRSEGIVWLPVDIIAGGVCSGAHLGHFTAVQLTRKMDSKKVELSFFETNGLTDKNYLYGAEDGAEKIVQRPRARLPMFMTLTKKLKLGDAEDFSFRKGVLNGGAIEALISPINRIAESNKDWVDAALDIIDVLNALALRDINDHFFSNPSRGINFPQTGGECNYKCIIEMLHNCQTIKPIAKYYLLKNISREALSVLADSRCRMNGLVLDSSQFSLEEAVKVAAGQSESCERGINREISRIDLLGFKL